MQYGGQSSYGPPFGPGLGIAVGVCCSIQVSCGETIRYNGTYFRNPGAPAPFSDSRACSVTVARQPNICQIRLDFLKFDLDRPRSGVCENDRFVVSGQASNSIIPPICGYNTGQHMYIDLDQGGYGPLTLNVITIGSRPRLFDIRVTYIHCNSVFRAPPNCLQYQNSLIGQIKSFNFEEFQVGAGTGYLSGLDYTICFKKPPGYCSITYTTPRQLYPDFGQSIIHQTTQAQTNYQVNPGQYFNIIGMVGNDQAGAGNYDCPQDYLQLANIPLCGSRLNSQLNPPTPNPTTNAEVIGKSCLVLEKTSSEGRHILFYEKWS